MSNPIADNADYFARWKQYSKTSQDQQDDEGQVGDQVLPTQALPTTITGTREAVVPTNNDSNISEHRSQWLRVLNRISFLNPLDTTTPTTNAVAENTDFSDDDSIIDRDTFELMRSAARHQKPIPASRHQSIIAANASSRHHSINVSTSAGGAIRGRDDDEEDHVVQDDEEKLPSVDDLENDHIDPLNEDRVEESNYFTRPFFPDRTIRTMLPTTPTTIRSHRNQQEEEEEDVRVKDKWDRTLDKLKLIANLQSSSTIPPHTMQLYTGPSHTLATYYPPAFDPIFACFAKDEYGRNLVIIILFCVISLCYLSLRFPRFSHLSCYNASM